VAVLRDKLTRNNYLIYGPIRLLAAGLLLAFSILCVYKLYFSESSKQPRTQATVIDNQKHTLGNGTESEEVIYTPVLEYTVNGQTYTTDQGVQAISQPYSIGQQVEIQYDPTKPTRVFQPAKSRSATLGVVAVAFAVPAITLGVRTATQMMTIRRSHP
jgi:hypothetical protein